MLDTEIATEAMADRQLLTEIFKFKARFYPQGFAKYDEALIGKVKLLPPDYRKTILAKDYQQMQEMIFGSYPDLNEIFTRIGEFEVELNKST